MSGKLPPLPNDLDKEYEAVKETVELKFPKCKHKEVRVLDSELRCKCGAGWKGPNMNTLYELFKNQ